MAGDAARALHESGTRFRDFFGVLTSEAAWQGSILAYLPMSRRGPLTEAWFYEAMRRRQREIRAESSAVWTSDLPHILTMTWQASFSLGNDANDDSMPWSF